MFFFVFYFLCFNENKIKKGIKISKEMPKSKLFLFIIEKVKIKLIKLINLI